MRDNTHVPDKLEGYLLQTRHALFELISFDSDRIVSVEAYDDVAIENNDTITAEQIKSVLSTNNPLTDRSIVFWKTIYNWSRYISTDSFGDKNVCLKYVVVAAQNLNVGNIAKSFHDATNGAQAKVALEAAKLEICGDSNNTKDVPKTLKKYIDYCFSEDNVAAVLRVIELFSVDLHESDYDDKLEKKFNSQAIPVEYCHDLFIHMLGWVDEEVHKQIKNNVPAYISTSDYLQELRAQSRRRDRSRILSAVSPSPGDKEKNDEINRRSTYIRQLELIDLDYTELVEAACDFIRTRTEKVEWAARGLVTLEDINDYNESLVRTWKTNKQLVKLKPLNSEVEKGKTIYYKCLSDAQGKSMQGCVVPPFFGAGSLQSLANEPGDSPQIGWHPDYIQLLKKEEDNG